MHATSARRPCHPQVAPVVEGTCQVGAACLHWGGPPCETYTAARQNDGLGPRPVRSATEPQGLPGLTWKEWQQIHIGDRLLRFILEMLLLMSILGYSGFIEHPQFPTWETNRSLTSIWCLKAIRLMKRLMCVSLVSFDQCVCGAAGAQTDNAPPGAIADSQATASSTGQFWPMSPSCGSTPGADRETGRRVLPDGKGQNLSGPHERDHWPGNARFCPGVEASRRCRRAPPGIRGVHSAAVHGPQHCPTRLPRDLRTELPGGHQSRNARRPSANTAQQQERKKGVAKNHQPENICQKSPKNIQTTPRDFDLQWISESEDFFWRQDFVQSLLVVDPKKRMSASEVRQVSDVSH